MFQGTSNSGYWKFGFSGLEVGCFLKAWLGCVDVGGPQRLVWKLCSAKVMLTELGALS